MIESINIRKFFDHLIQAGSADQLHDMVMDAIFQTNSEDGNDVGVVQSGRQPRFAMETGEPVGMCERRTEKHLDGNPPPQRLLLRFVNDPHAASADSADDSVFADPFGVATSS